MTNHCDFNEKSEFNKVASCLDENQLSFRMVFMIYSTSGKQNSLDVIESIFEISFTLSDYLQQEAKAKSHNLAPGLLQQPMQCNTNSALPLSWTIRREISFRTSATWESFNMEALLSWIKSATTSGLNGFSFKANRIYLRKISSTAKPVCILIWNYYSKSYGICAQAHKILRAAINLQKMAFQSLKKTEKSSPNWMVRSYTIIETANSSVCIFCQLD